MVVFLAHCYLPEFHSLLRYVIDIYSYCKFLNFYNVSFEYIVNLVHKMIKNIQVIKMLQSNKEYAK